METRDFKAAYRAIMDDDFPAHKEIRLQTGSTVI
jgi:hypothetical protein